MAQVAPRATHRLLNDSLALSSLAGAILDYEMVDEGGPSGSAMADL